MKIYLAELELWNYTLTTFSLTEEDVIKTMKTEWLRQKKQHRWGRTWKDASQDLRITELEQNYIEWM